MKHSNVKTSITIGEAHWKLLKHLGNNHISEGITNLVQIVLHDPVFADRFAEQLAENGCTSIKHLLDKLPMEQTKRGTVTGGKRRTIYLSDETWQTAERLGGGNVSAGVRLALETYPD